MLSRKPSSNVNTAKRWPERLRNRSGTSSMEMMSYLMRRKNASMPVRRSTVMSFPGIKVTSSAVLTREQPRDYPAPRWACI